VIPLPFVGLYAIVFWIVFLWAYWPEWTVVRQATRAQGEADSKSLQVILVGQSVAFFIAWPMAWIPALQSSPAHRVAMFYAGVAAIVGGSVLRRHCFRMLGPSFTGDVRARPDQEIVNRGAYRLLRHPSYTAGIVLNTGVGLALGSWACVLLVGGASLIVYLYRINVEERALLAVVGEPYRQFVGTRKRLIPFVY
jgi:protein-S-isoprenylcysteine O-methyltransferase Ste14